MAIGLSTVITGIANRKHIRIGTICCSDGEYPEAVRALTFNGAEVVYRPSEAMPMTGSGYPGGGSWMIQNRGHAEFNTVYMLCPNAGPVY